MTGAPTCPKPSVRASAPLCPARHSIIKALSIASVVIQRSREPGRGSLSHRFAPLQGANPNSKHGPLFRGQSRLTNPSDTRLLQKLETHFLQSQKFMALPQQNNRLQNTSLSPQFSNTVFNTVVYEAELKGNEKTVRKVCF